MLRPPIASSRTPRRLSCLFYCSSTAGIGGTRGSERTSSRWCVTRFVPTYQHRYPSDSAPYHSNPYRVFVHYVSCILSRHACYKVAAEGDEHYWANDSTASLDAGTFQCTLPVCFRPTTAMPGHTCSCASAARDGCRAPLLQLVAIGANADSFAAAGYCRERRRPCACADDRSRGASALACRQ